MFRGFAPWYSEGDPPTRRHRTNVHTNQGCDAYSLLWNSGVALLSILGVVCPRESVAEMARSIVEYDAGWRHDFRSDLDRVDQYSGAGARWSSPTLSTTCRPCGGTWRWTGMHCGNGYAHSAGMTSPLTLEEHDNRS